MKIIEIIDEAFNPNAEARAKAKEKMNTFGNQVVGVMRALGVMSIVYNYWVKASELEIAFTYYVNNIDKDPNVNVPGISNHPAVMSAQSAKDKKNAAKNAAYRTRLDLLGDAALQVMVTTRTLSKLVGLIGACKIPILSKLAGYLQRFLEWGNKNDKGVVNAKVNAGKGVIEAALLALFNNSDAGKSLKEVLSKYLILGGVGALTDLSMTTVTSSINAIVPLISEQLAKIGINVDLRVPEVLQTKIKDTPEMKRDNEIANTGQESSSTNDNNPYQVEKTGNSVSIKGEVFTNAQGFLIPSKVSRYTRYRKSAEIDGNIDAVPKIPIDTSKLKSPGKAAADDQYEFSEIPQLLQ